MYSIIQIEGKQILIKPNYWYDFNLKKDININDFIFFNKILLFKKLNTIQLGYPFLLNSIIIGKVIQKIKSIKITILKTKPKKNYTRTKGYREIYTRILIQN